MSEGTKTRPSRGGNVMLDTVEGVAGGVARFGYGLLDMGLGLLPSQSRQHMRNAIRELSYAFASLPADFAEIAGVEIERWASVSDEAAPSATVAATATVATPAPATGKVAAATPAPAARSAAATVSAATPATGKAAPAPGSASATGSAAAATPAPAARSAAATVSAATPATGKAASAPGSAPATGKAAPAPGSAPATGKAAPAPGSAPTGGAAPAAGKAAPAPGSAPATGKAAAPAASSAPATGSAAAASDSASAPVTRISSAAAAASASSTGVTIAYIEFDPPGRDVEGEYVLIRNDSSAPVSLTSWQLEDGQARHTYVFPTCMLAPGAELKLWTRAGVNDGANLYWGQRVAVWNNEGDTCTLLDATGAVVSRFSYTGKKGPTA